MSGHISNGYFTNGQFFLQIGRNLSKFHILHANLCLAQTLGRVLLAATVGCGRHPGPPPLPLPLPVRASTARSDSANPILKSWSLIWRWHRADVSAVILDQSSARAHARSISARPQFSTTSDFANAAHRACVAAALSAAVAREDEAAA
jgi:hypothetical protein